MSAGAQVGAEIVKSRVEVGSREALAERIEDVVRGLAGIADAAEFAAEHRGVEQRARHAPGGGEGGRLVDRGSARGVDDTGAEPDGRAVSFPDPAHAHHESQAACRHVGLVGVGHHAGVAQRRPFDGVLAGKRRSQQQYSRIGEVDVRIQAVGELAGVSSESAYQVTVASVEADDDVVQGRPNVVVGQGEDALEHHSRARLLKLKALLAGYEEPGDHPRGVGRDPVRVAGGEPGVHQSHCGTNEKRCACCRVEITARVDSAPWLRLTHSASNPSKPPPVSVSHMTNPESLAP